MILYGRSSSILVILLSLDITVSFDCNKILQLGIVLFGNLYFLYQIKNIKNKLAKLSVICFLPLIFNLFIANPNAPTPGNIKCVDFSSNFKLLVIIGL